MQGSLGRQWWPIVYRITIKKSPHAYLPIPLFFKNNNNMHTLIFQANSPLFSAVTPPGYKWKRWSGTMRPQGEGERSKMGSILADERVNQIA
jgi:hypothetical protein